MRKLAAAAVLGVIVSALGVTSAQAADTDATTGTEKPVVKKSPKGDTGWRQLGS